MSFCDFCTFEPQHCRKRSVRLVTNRELDCRVFRHDFRSFLASLRVHPTQALDFLTDCFRDSDCAVVIDDAGPIEFDPEVLDFKNFRWWYRDLCRVNPAIERTRLRDTRREELRVLATLVRIIFPVESAMWGTGRITYPARSRVRIRALH